MSVVIAEEMNRNRGIATEAITLLLNHVFGELELHKIELTVFSDNGAAIECYTRLGFKVEGRLKDHAIVDGTYRDMILMGIIETDWTGKSR